MKTQSELSEAWEEYFETMMKKFQKENREIFTKKQRDFTPIREWSWVAQRNLARGLK